MLSKYSWSLCSYSKVKIWLYCLEDVPSFMVFHLPAKRLNSLPWRSSDNSFSPTNYFLFRPPSRSSTGNILCKSADGFLLVWKCLVKRASTVVRESYVYNLKYFRTCYSMLLLLLIPKTPVEETIITFSFIHLFVLFSIQHFK